MTNKKDLTWARKQSQSRLRPRSTVFDDGIDRENRRQQRRLTDKKIIDEELELEEQIFEDLLEEDYNE